MTERSVTRAAVTHKTDSTIAASLAGYLSRLEALTAALADAVTSEQVADVIITHGLPAMGARYGAVTLLSEDGTEFVNLRMVGYPPEVVEAWKRYPADTPVALPDAVRRREMIVFESWEERRNRYPDYPPARSVGSDGALVVIPLLLKDRAIGAIGLGFPTEHSFNSDELTFLQTLGGQCALALERARLYDVEREARERAQAEIAEREQAERMLHKRAEEIGLLYEAGRLLGSTLDLETIYDTMRRLIASVMDCDGLILSRYDAEERMIRCTYAWVEGSRVDTAVFPPVPLAPEGRGMQSTVIWTGEPLRITDVQERRKTSDITYDVEPDGTVHDKPDESKPQTHSAIMVPIKLEGQVVGVLQVQSHRPDAFSGDDL